jgi:hypothetical protein
MNCATHNDTAAVAFCRTCGKPLCGNCTRDVRGVVYCEPCLAARLESTAPAAGFVPPQPVYPPVGTNTGPAPCPAPVRILQSPAFLLDSFPLASAPFTARNTPRDWLTCSSSAADLWLRSCWKLGLRCSVWASLFSTSTRSLTPCALRSALQEGQPAPDPFGLGQLSAWEKKARPANIPTVAIILIGLGVLFLLHTMNIWSSASTASGRSFSSSLGGWMFARQWGMIGVRPKAALVKLPHAQSCRLQLQHRCRMRKIMGPAMLLTLGTLFLLQSLEHRRASNAPGPPGSCWWSAS